MERKRPRCTLAALLVVLVAASGCLQKEYQDPPAPTATTTTRSVGYANLLTNWTDLDGSFHLYNLTTDIEQWDAESATWKPYRTLCPKLAYWFYDAANATVWLRRDIAIHPSDPGPLTAVWLNNIRHGPGCFNFGFWGVNENPMERTVPVFGTNPAQEYFFINVTFTRDGDAPPHRIRVHNTTFEEGENGTVAWEAEAPGPGGLLVRATAHLEYLGPHPFASVRRF